MWMSQVSPKYFMAKVANSNATRANIAPRGNGVEPFLQLRQFDPFEQREVAGIVFLVVIQIHGVAELDLVQSTPDNWPYGSKREISK